MNYIDHSLTHWMADSFEAKPSQGAREFDYVTPDRRSVFEVRLRRQGIRDVRDAMLQLAAYLGSSAGRNQRGFVLISLTRSAPQRVLAEWLAAKAVLLPGIAKRLFLVAMVDGRPVVEPSNEEMQNMADQFQAVAAQVEGIGGAMDDAWPRPAPARQITTSWKHLEIEKVLVHRWLRGEGPIGIGKIKQLVGCSYPTVKEATKALIHEGVVRTASAGALELVKYSRDQWSELAAASRRAYRPVEYVDATGDAKAADKLLARLRRPGEGHRSVGIGGVAAARYWDSRFDLNGTPRVDLVLHLPHGADNPDRTGRDFVRKLDPALKRRDAQHSNRSTVLVVHPIHRRESLFTADPKQALSWADPVETILHLNDMGLTAQAGELVSRLRSRTSERPKHGRT